MAVIANARSQKSRRTCRWLHVIKIRLVRGPRLFLVPWYVRTHKRAASARSFHVPHVLARRRISRRCLINYRVRIPRVHSVFPRTDYSCVQSSTFSRTIDDLTECSFSPIATCSGSRSFSIAFLFFPPSFSPFAMDLYKVTFHAVTITSSIVQAPRERSICKYLPTRHIFGSSSQPLDEYSRCVHGRCRSRRHAMTLQQKARGWCVTVLKSPVTTFNLPPLYDRTYLLSVGLAANDRHRFRPNILRASYQSFAFPT